MTGALEGTVAVAGGGRVAGACTGSLPGDPDFAPLHFEVIKVEIPRTGGPARRRDALRKLRLRKLRKRGVI